MRRLPVDLIDLEAAIEFRGDSLDGEQSPYFDLETGQVIWVWESDEAFAAVSNLDPQRNRDNREAIEASQDRFIAIPELDPADDNEMLSAFLDSDWTTDETKRRKAIEAYHGSVGGWRRSIRDDPTILHAWRDFEQQAIHDRALEFLADYGIEPIEQGGN